MKKILLVIIGFCFVMSGTNTFAMVRSNNIAFLVNIDDFLPWNSGGSAKAMGMSGAFTAVADELAGRRELT